MSSPIRARWRRRAAAALALLAAACGPDGDVTAPTTAAAPDGPRFAISDGARNGGLQGFYFLAPIAAPVAYPGTFDPARQPVVEVCRWSGTACVGQPVAQFSAAAGTVAVSAADEAYRADWRIAGIARGQLYRVRVLEQGVPLGHADAKIPGPGETAAGLRAQQVVPLGNSPVLAVRFRMEVNTKPEVAITAPADGASLPAGSTVTLTGTAADAEQGDVSGQIVWRSSRLVDPIGTGASVSAALPMGKHTITASVTDGAGGTSTASRTLYLSILSVPQALDVPYGGTASLPITLSEPAPAGGLALTVATADAGKVGVGAATVTVPAGQQSANAVLSGVAPGAAAVTVSSAEYGAVTAQVNVAASLRFVEGGVSFPRGRTGTLNVRLESNGVGIAAPAGGLEITLTSANPACAAVASPVTIAEGLVQTTTPATVTYGGSAQTPCSTTISASLAGAPSVTSNAVGASVGAEPAITFANTYGAVLPVGAGLRHQGGGSQFIQLGAPAPAGGLAVTLTSSDPTKAVVAASSGGSTNATGAGSVTVAVPAGQSVVYYAVDGMEGQSGTANVTASAPGYQSATLPVAVRPLAVQLATSATTTALSPNGYVYGYVCYANAAGTAAESCGQLIRPGGQARTLTFTSSNADVGRLVVTGGATGQTVTGVVAVGQNTTPTNPSTDGAVTFDPLGAGTTTVSVSSAGAVAGPSASQQVAVSAPSITVANLYGGTTFTVGAGLRYQGGNSQYVQLGAPAPEGGLTLTLTSADPSKAVVALGNSSALAGAGAGAATVTIPAGQSNAYFAVDGVENQTGSTTVTFSAPGYQSAPYTVALRQLAVFIGTPATTTTLSPNTYVYANLCYANAAGTGHENCGQPIRPGGQSRTLTFANSNAGVGRLAVTGGATGQTVTATLNPGETATSSNPNVNGAVSFDPLGPGATAVSVSSPGVVSGASASQQVTVSAPAITFHLGGTLAVGQGLRFASNPNTPATYIRLGAPAPAGGLALTLTSADPSKVVVAAGTSASLGAGAGTATVTIPQGASELYWWAADGVEGQTGTVAVTASAPGYQSATLDVQLRQPALLIGAQGTTTTLSPNTYVYATLCYANAAGTTAEGCGQPIRAGGQARTLTFTNSTASVGQLAVMGGAAGQSVTATLNPGETATSSNPNVNGAVGFDPAAAGTTTVSVTSPGAVAGSNASQAITVTAPAITVSAPSGASVVAGQTSGCLYVNLAAPAPAGTTVTLTSSAGGVLRLATGGACGGAGSAPSGSLAVPIAAGQQTVHFVAVGGPGAGTVVITASAPGYTNGTLSFTVTP